MPLIYKIVSAEEWRDAATQGYFAGSAIDRRDGFIHLSSASQVAETAARHFAGMTDLLLVAVDEEAVTVRWEPSRGGALFPHLYGPLRLDAVRSTHALPLGADGRHILPFGVGPGSDPALQSDQ